MSCVGLTLLPPCNALRLPANRNSLVSLGIVVDSLLADKLSAVSECEFDRAADIRKVADEFVRKEIELLWEIVPVSFRWERNMCEYGARARICLTDSNDAAIAQLPGIPHLTEISAVDSTVSDHGIRCLGLERLRILVVRRTPVSETAAHDRAS